MIQSDRLDALVKKGMLKSYLFDFRDDTGENPYMRLEMIFPDGTQVVIIPEGQRIDGVERIGIFP